MEIPITTMQVLNRIRHCCDGFLYGLQCVLLLFWSILIIKVEFFPNPNAWDIHIRPTTIVRSIVVTILHRCFSYPFSRETLINTLDIGDGDTFILIFLPFTLAYIGYILIWINILYWQRRTPTKDKKD